LQVRDAVVGTEQVLLEVVILIEDDLVVLLEELLVDVLFDDELVEVFDVNVEV
jgi:hypothetical protein